MSTFARGPISVEIESESVTITDTPTRETEEQEGTAKNPATFSSLDGWLGRFGFFEFPAAQIIIGKFFWHKIPVVSPYDRLERAGTVTVVSRNGRWIIPVRALKTEGKAYPTLNRVTHEDLDFLAEGNFKDFLSTLGEFEMGRYGDLVPNAGKTVANGLGLSVPREQVGPLMGFIAVTRPLALIKRFGQLS